MNRKKLLKLRELIRTEKRIKLSMERWGWHAGAHPPPADNWCGTAVCALGLAAVSGRFRGLKGQWVEVPELGGVGLKITYSGTVRRRSFDERLIPFDAAEACFGLTRPQAMHIFGDSYDVDLELVKRRQVLRHIDQVLAGRVP